MNEPTDPNDLAFSDCEGGITKREYFAAQALSGLLAYSENVGSSAANARAAVHLADALIQELNKT